MALRQFARASASLFRLQGTAPLLSTSLSRNYSTGKECKVGFERSVDRSSLSFQETRVFFVFFSLNDDEGQQKRCSRARRALVHRVLGSRIA